LLDNNTREREVRGIVEAMKSYNLKKSLILTFKEKETIFTEGFTIDVIPVYQWLLQKPIY